MADELSKIIFGLTYQCQANCVHCSCAGYPAASADELSLSEIRDVIRQAARLGAGSINLFGGEPTLRKDFIDILAYAAARIPVITVDTNGVRFTEAFTRQVRPYGIDTLFVSLAGACETVHNRFQRASTFHRAVNAVKNAVAAWIHTHVSVCAFRHHVDTGELERIILLAEELGAAGVRIAPPIRAGNWLNRSGELLSADEMARVRGLARKYPNVYLVEEDEGFFTRCHAVTGGSIYISPSGHVQPCSFIPISFGNVRAEPFERIYARMRVHADFSSAQLEGECPMRRADFVERVRTHIDPGSGLWHMPPLQVLDLGTPCNNHCSWCQRPASISLSAGDVMKRMSAMDDGYREVMIAGGEPSIHPEILDILRLGQTHDRKTILYTNARLFSYPDRAPRFKKAGLGGVVVPICAAGPADFDRATRVPNGFRQTLAGIKNLLRHRVRVQVELPGDPALNRLADRLAAMGVNEIARLEQPLDEAPPRCGRAEPDTKLSAVFRPAAAEPAATLVYADHWREKPDRKAYEVVLVYPDHESAEVNIQLPYALVYLATPLAAAGVSVKLIDERVNPDWRQELPGILGQSPDLRCIGISCFISRQIAHAVAMARFIRETAPKIPIVWGGYLPSTLPEVVLRSGLADYVVVGEGEGPFQQLVAALKRGGPVDGIPGLARLENNRFVFEENRAFITLDHLPDLALNLLDIRHYKHFRKGIQWSLYTSRGCTHHCRFCSVSRMNHNRWRAMGPDRVVREMRRLVDMGARDIAFCEDNFFLDSRRTAEMARQLARDPLPVTWSASCRVDALLRMPDDLLSLYRSSGLRHLHIGAESGSERILKLINKRITPADILRVNRTLRAHRLVPEYIFMMGFPTETDAEKQMTLALIRQLKKDHPGAWFWRMNQYIPYPGTPLFDMAVQDGFTPPATLEQWADYGWYRGPAADAIDYDVAF